MYTTKVLCNICIYVRTYQKYILYARIYNIHYGVWCKFRPRLSCRHYVCMYVYVVCGSVLARSSAFSSTMKQNSKHTRYSVLSRSDKGRSYSSWRRTYSQNVSILLKQKKISTVHTLSNLISWSSELGEAATVALSLTLNRNPLKQCLDAVKAEKYVARPSLVPVVLGSVSLLVGSIAS